MARAPTKVRIIHSGRVASHCTSGSIPRGRFTGYKMKGGGTTDIDDQFAMRGFENIGAWILGRNMFGPIRGAWPDENWKGWWGDDPPCHAPVFALTHHPRTSFSMTGGTSFPFYHDWHSCGAGTGDRGRSWQGRPSRRRSRYNSAIFPRGAHRGDAPGACSDLGSGEHLFDDIDLPKLRYQCAEHVPTSNVTHIVLSKTR